MKTNFPHRIAGTPSTTLALPLPTKTAHDPLPSQWQVLRSAPASGSRNMAVDAALLEHARTSSDGVWRCYAWQRPTVSFGRHEVTRGRFDARSIARAGVDAVRRPTGGRALLHAREVTYSVTLPLAASIPWKVAYGAVNAVLLEVLRSLGVDATIVDHESAPFVRPDGPVCFDAPAPGEIVVGGAKLVGSAVWRDRGAFLQHGSILLHDDQSMLADASCATLPIPPAAASLATCCAEVPSWSDVANALEAVLRRRCAVRPFAEPTGFSALVDTHEASMARADWLWRR